MATPRDTYEKPQLFDLLGSNGFTGHALEIGAAIIAAESGGRRKARNVNADGSIDRGIWQINNKAHPDVSDACAYDPGCATRAAWHISKGGTDWSPWNSSKHVWGSNVGKPGSLAAASGAQAETGIPGLDTAFDGLKAIGAFFLTLLQGDTWLRILKVLGGGILILMGITQLTGADKFIRKAIP